MSHYYAFANGTPLIERKTLKSIVYDLIHYYKNIGEVIIVDENKTVIRTMTLKGKTCIQETPPNENILAAVSGFSYDNGYTKDVLIPVKYGPGVPPKICF